jgi:hypothetical protein
MALGAFSNRKWRIASAQNHAKLFGGFARLDVFRIGDPEGHSAQFVAKASDDVLDYGSMG